MFIVIKQVLSFEDLRQYLQLVEKMGELKIVDGADWNLEVGAITEIAAGKREPPAILFDNIKGYPKGFKILTNCGMTQSRTSIILGVDQDLRGLDLLRAYRDKMRNFKPVKPIEVDDGPILENTMTGDQVNLYKFPVPRWHELDGGRYIGTGDVVVTKDYDEDWVNLGTYRVQLHEKNIVTIYISPSHHARIMREKYWSKGEDFPVAISLGHDPTLFLAATLSSPWGISEYDLAGYIKSKPIKVIKGAVTGLPFPAFSEIVIEGRMSCKSDDAITEGPFGEFTGYYAGGRREERIVKVEAVHFRSNPIILGAPPLKPPAADTFGIPLNAANVWEEIENVGVMGVKGVWDHLGLDNMFTVVSIRQLGPGHSQQVGLASISGHAGSDMGRFVVIVDDDIDPSNLGEVIWAISTRCDPKTSMTIIDRCPSSPLDPRIDPERKSKSEFTNSRAIIDATKPYEWFDKFPPVNTISSKLKSETLSKWKEVFSDN